MSLAISTENALETIGESGINAPTTATGYDVSDLYTGGLGRGWMSSAAGTVHEFDINAAGVAYDCLALFDVRGEGGVGVTSVSLKFGTAYPPIALLPIGTITLNSRGDGAWLASTGAHACLTLEVNLASSARVYVGQIWLGNRTTLTKMPARLRPRKQGNTITNISDVRSVTAAKIGGPTRSFELEFAALEESEGDEIEAVFDELDGAFLPAVLVPDTSEATAIYLGRFGDAVAWEMDPSLLRVGHSLTFTEDGRPHA